MTRPFTPTAFSTNDTQFFIDCLTGPVQHDAHMKSHRWNLYVRDSHKRMDAVWAELRKMRAEREERIEQLRREADMLEAAE